MKFSQFLEMKFLEWQQSQGGRKTVNEFAAYIGVSKSTISTWWNENRSPEGENVQKLAKKLGIEVYDVLGLPRPDLNKRIADINTRLDHTRQLLADLQAAATRQRTSQQILKTLAQTVHTLPHYLQTSPPQRANATLHTFIQSIHLTKDHILTIEFK